MNEEILLVTTHNCPKCHEAMKKLDAAGVDYKLTAAEENAEYVEKLGISEAATIIIRPEDEYEIYTKIYSGLGGVYRFLRSLEKNE